jgi:hypothetical protein
MVQNACFFGKFTVFGLTKWNRCSAIPFWTSAWRGVTDLARRPLGDRECAAGADRGRIARGRPTPADRVALPGLTKDDGTPDGVLCASHRER